MNRSEARKVLVESIAKLCYLSSSRSNPWTDTGTLGQIHADECWIKLAAKYIDFILQNLGITDEPDPRLATIGRVKAIAREWRRNIPGGSDYDSADFMRRICDEVGVE